MCKVYEFRINHKPKKIKEICYGTHVYSNLYANKTTLTLFHNKYYGLQTFRQDGGQQCSISKQVELQQSY